MISFLGRSLILIGLAACTIGAVTGFISGRRQDPGAYAWTRRMAWLFSACMALANGLMVYALVTNDFSVSYVAQVGSLSSPMHIRVVALWSSLEGSILFWGLILGGYVAFMNALWGKKHPDYMPYALGTVLAIGTFFCFLIAGPADPFSPMSPVPTDGPGPNPLLQNHILMAVHPPTLYLGYVGMSIPFGMAVAALLRGHLGPGWLTPMRIALVLPWTFLSLGIVLGGWWAYEVLGWGGYWAWDPVENASFLPWLVATPAIHSIVVNERRGNLKGWTVILVLSSFLLTLLGTFMTRSGVFNSVHSFTQSAIGPTFLVFIAICLLASILLLAFRLDTLAPEAPLPVGVNREFSLLVQNFLFTAFCFTVLLGTVFPLVAEAINGVKLSVGEPYFNAMAIPLGLGILLTMGLGNALPWGEVSEPQLVRRLTRPLVGAVLLAIPAILAGFTRPLPLLTTALGGYAVHASLHELWVPIAARRRARGESLFQALAFSFSRNRRRYAGQLSHLSVIGIIVSIAISTAYQERLDVVLERDEVAEMGPYSLRFLQVSETSEAHRVSTFVEVEVSRDGKVLETMRPAMNQYRTQRQPIGTPDVRTELFRDLYLSIQHVEPGGQRVGLRVFLNPMVPWLWWCAGLLFLSGLIAAMPGRRKARGGGSS